MIPEILLLAEQVQIPDADNPDVGITHMLGIVAVSFMIDTRIDHRIRHNRAAAMDFEFRHDMQRYMLVSDGKGGKEMVKEKLERLPPKAGKTLMEVIGYLSTVLSELRIKAPKDGQVD